MTPEERHITRRAVIVVEIEAIEKNLTAARARETAADNAHAESKAKWVAFNEYALAGLPDYATVAGRYHVWLLDERDSLMKPAEDERGAARCAVKSLEDALALARDDLGQIDRALTANAANKVRELRPAAETSPRRVAPIIEFDNISPPREAAR